MVLAQQQDKGVDKSAMRNPTQLAVALQRLAKSIDGDVLADALERKLYSNDASVYQELPMAVLRPRHAQDLQTIVRWADQQQLPLIPRAGGTSLAGQVVGAGVIVDVSRYMHNYGVYNKDERWIEVDVGIIQDDLNDKVAVDALTFGPDTSTSNRCMIGGMIGNNACGEHSLIHGTTRDHALAMDVVLADGSNARFGPLNAAELAEKKSLENLEGAIYRGIYGLIDQHRNLIQTRFPKPQIIRRNTGYALDALTKMQPWNPDGPVFNLSPLICGSEGTLCMVSAARLNLEPLPQRKIVCCVHCETVVEACRATQIALKHQPSAIELMDSNILEATKANLTQQRNRFWVQGDPGAVLPIEFYGTDDVELEERCQALIADLQVAGYGYAFPLLKHDQVKHCWDLRRAGLGLLMGIPGDKKSMPLLEDAAVAVEDLPAYVEAVQAIMARHKLNIVYYAHASVGLLHIRPQIDLKQACQVALFEQLGHEVFKVVQSFGGSISGEHGDGRLRAPFIKELFGEECYDLFRQVKHIFDPKNIFNPHKIVDPLPMASDLRYVPDYQTPDLDTVFDWSADQGLVRATEKCNGAGACRKSPGRGTMCPSYHATLEEKHSTRGRANIFRQALKADDPRSAFSDPQLEEVLDLCLSCKACKSECPASVDMGRLKAEFFQQKYQSQRPSLRTRLFANFSKQARFASYLPRWMQGVMNLPLSKRMIGIHPQRSMPPFSRLRFADWITQRAPVAVKGELSEVVLFVDEFSQYLDTSMLRDAVLLLEHLGFHVHALWDIDSGRAALSKGFVTAARGHLQDCIEKLKAFAERGLPIIGLEPSAILGLRDEAIDLMPDAASRVAAQLVAQYSVTLEEFLIARAPDLNFTGWQAPAAEVLVHEHCHAKALLGAGITVQALQLFSGWQIKLINAGCCGMAGSFGYEKEHYAVSMTIGEQLLFPAVRAAQAEILLCAPGTSCRHQILDGTQREALHPAQILLRGFSNISK